MAWVQSQRHTERKRDPSLRSCPLTSTHKCYGTCVPTQTYHTYTGIKHDRGLWLVSSLLVFHQECPSTQVRKASPSDISTGIVKGILKRIAQGKRQIDNWNYMKLKSFALKKRNRTCRKGENLCQLYIWQGFHIQETCNKKEKPEKPKVSNQEKGQMNNTDISQKKCKWQDIHEMCIITQMTIKTTLRHHQSEWLSSRKQKVTKVDEAIRDILSSGKEEGKRRKEGGGTRRRGEGVKVSKVQK